MQELKMVYLPVAELKPYERNARKHSEADVQTIVESIQDFGFRDPIGVWGDKNLIVEGHGRYLAALKLGLETVPCIRLDDMTVEERKAYALAHNKTAEMSVWDFDVLADELMDLSEMGMDRYGFDISEDTGVSDGSEDVPDLSRYAQGAKIPQYEPKGDLPEISDLVNVEKQKELVEEINEADIPDDVKEFLILAAQRHNVFNYRNIAEFYAHQDATVQRLMEKSALVIIDINDAIANGYVKLTKTIQDLLEDEDDE